jgi:thiol-disulfide isomerase/thioredoxin
MTKRVIMTCLLVACLLAAKSGEVRLHGSAKELKTARITLYHAGSSSEIGNHLSMSIPVDAAGSFDITFPLDRPAYYTTGMHTLYLSPGDDMEIVLTRAPARATFAGKGSKANIYLKGTRWSLPGSGFSLEKPPIEKVLEKADSIAGARLRDLSALPASKEFKKLEKARIIAYKVSAYLDHFSRTGFYRWNDLYAVKEEKKIDYYRTVKGEVEPLLRRIARDEALLECPAVREALLECHRAGVFTFRTTGKLAELAGAIRVSKEMDAGIRTDNLDAFRAYSLEITNPVYREAFEEKLARRTRFMAGQPAVDVELRDVTGKTCRLGDFRGRVLFIDFWATWCLPCLAQAPHVKALSEKYSRVQFIAISIDQEAEKWREKLARDGDDSTIRHFIASPFEMAAAWDITSIPRFILVDEQFNIITAFAPRPSDATLLEPLLEKYSK